MSKLILLNKPFQVLCQFRKNDDRKTLADYINIPHVNAAGRLDYDSEGLLLLTDDGALNHYLAHPKFNKQKTYHVQVEGDVSEQAILRLTNGITLKDGPTKPAAVKRIPEPDIWKREPPIRERKAIPTSWLEIQLTEGKNRQVRRMTAHVGHPTLRLIRVAIGEWQLDDLQPGEYKIVETTTPEALKEQTADKIKGQKKTDYKNRFSKQIKSTTSPKGRSRRHNQLRQNQNRTT